MSTKTRYAVVGTGGRAGIFIRAAAKQYAQHAELVGLCDISAARMAFWNDELKSDGVGPVPAYDAQDFDRMVEQQQPDVVIVTTVDAVHHQYIIRALELGCDVVTEKPMTTDEAKAQAIVDTVAKTGGNVRVTFNYRFQPGFTKLREIVMSGEIGEPTLVDFQWVLDTSHGADYFRRWHREKAKSGGLLVHKSTHHFDLVNFWVASQPKTVFAMGDTMFYGKANAEKRGEHYSYDRYTDEPAAEGDPFALPLKDNRDPHAGLNRRPDRMQRMYYDAEGDHDFEKATAPGTSNGSGGQAFGGAASGGGASGGGASGGGYVRDRNVFSDKWPLDAEDTMAVTARYRNGVILNYSLIAYCPWEGERVSITGTRGRVEYFARGKGHVITGQTDEELGEQMYQGEKYLRLQKMFGPAVDVEIPKATGGHGGGDALILDQIFLPDGQKPEDPFHRSATHTDGAASILLGVAANKSIATGQAVDVDSLIQWPAAAGR